MNELCDRITKKNMTSELNNKVQGTINEIDGHNLKKCLTCNNTKWSWDDKRQNYYCENCLDNSKIVLEVRDKVKGLTKVVDDVYVNLKDWDNQVEEVLQVNSEDDRIRRKEYCWKELMRVRVKQIRLKIEEFFNLKDYNSDWFENWNKSDWIEKQGKIYLETLVEVANELFDIISVFVGDEGDKKIDEVNDTIIEWILEEMPHFRNELIDKYGEHYIQGIETK